MRVLRRIPSRPVRWRRVVAAIGIFDGIHRGHQAILRRAVARARAVGGTPVAVTFHPHPLAVLKPSRLPPMLMSLEGRLRAFEACGVRAAVVLPFTRSFSRWTPEQFARRLLFRALRAREVVVGHDFGFGRGRSGDVETLRRLGHRCGFAVRSVGPVRLGGRRISSRRLREAIVAGRLKPASRMLGRPPSVVGRVARGAGRGSRLGFPTANLKVEAGVLPPSGVYAVSALLQGRRYAGMANLGVRPTFARRRKFRRTLLLGTVHSREVSPKEAFLILEAHLFGLRRRLYGRRLEVQFLRRLRPERRFPSAEALARQLARDARSAKRVFTLQGR